MSSEEESVVDKVGVGVSSLTELDQSLLISAYEINLHCNRLSNLKGLPKLSNLRSMNLSSNEFRTSDLPELSFLPCLVNLDLGGNALESLVALPFLPSLKDVSFAFNAITSLNGIENLPNLNNLDLRGNRISHPSDVLSLRYLQSILNITMADKNNRNSNPLCNNHRAMIAIFDLCPTLIQLDHKSQPEWPQPSDFSLTPKYDKIAQRFLKQVKVGLSEAADKKGLLPIIDKSDTGILKLDELLHPLQIDISGSISLEGIENIDNNKLSNIKQNNEGTLIKPELNLSETNTEFHFVAPLPLSSQSENNPWDVSQENPVVQMIDTTPTTPPPTTTTKIVNTNTSTQTSPMKNKSVSVEIQAGEIADIKDTTEIPPIDIGINTSSNLDDDDDEDSIEKEIQIEETLLVRGYEVGWCLARLASITTRNRYKMLRFAFHCLAGIRYDEIGDVNTLLSIEREAKLQYSNSEASHANERLQWDKKLAFSTQQIESMKRQLLIKEAKITSLNQDLDNSKSQVESKDAEAKIFLQQAKAEYSAARDTSAAMENQWQSKLDNVQQEVLQVQRALSESMGGAILLQQRLEHSEVRGADAEARVLQLVQQVTTSDNIQKELEKRVQTAEWESIQLRSQQDTVISNLRNELTIKSKEEKDSLRIALEKRSENESGLKIRAEKRLMKLQQVFDESIAAADDRTQALSLRLKEHQSGMARLMQAMKEMKTTMGRLRSRCVEAEARGAQLASRLAESEASHRVTVPIPTTAITTNTAKSGGETEKELRRMRQQVSRIEKVLRRRGLELRSMDSSQISAALSRTNSPTREIDNNKMNDDIDDDDDDRGEDEEDELALDSLSAEHHQEMLLQQNDAAGEELIALRERMEELEVAVRVKETMLEDQNNALRELREALNESENARTRDEDRVERSSIECEEARLTVKDMEKRLQASYKVERKLRSLLKELTAAESY